MVKILDVSLTISPTMMVWPKDPAVKVEPARRISRGDGANVSELTMGSHTGTHVDPPFHFIDGAKTIEEIDPRALVGPAYVADFTGVEDQISIEDLESLNLENIERILFKTSNSDIWAQKSAEFPDHYVSLSPEGAAWLVERNYMLVGIDFLSIEKRGSPGHPTHHALLEAGVVIVEGLDLVAVAPGVYELVCLPLKIEGGDGAPARTFLLQIS